MTDQTSKEVTAKTDTKAAEKTLANIVRGTLPKPLVYLIRFNETGGKEADIAKKYGTTSGKVADIIKNRNFAYIDKDYKPSQADIDASVNWLKQVPEYDKVGTDAVVNAVAKMPVASDADLAALTAKRAAVRATNAAEAGKSPKTEGKQPAHGQAKQEAKPASKAQAADLMK